MPFDEDRDDDPVSSGPPPPPEDRLWRHPSELASDERAPVGRHAAGARPALAGASPTVSARPGWGVVTAAGAAGAVVALGVVAIAGWWRPTTVQRQTVEPARSHESAPKPVALYDMSVAGVVKRTSPSVAQVKVNLGSEQRVGSGVVLGPAGYLVTSAALVGSQGTARVTFSDGTSFDGRVVSTDTVTALAVVHVDSSTLRTPDVAHTAPHVGDPAVAVSGPTDPARTGLVTAGIVSGENRVVTAANGELHDMVETDRPVPNESDGGALVNGDGALVGVCLRPADSAGASAGTAGWAVPIDVAVKVVTDVAMTGHARHVWLGAEVADPPASTGRSSAASSRSPTDAEGDVGPVVQSVSPASPAARAGLRSGDVVTAIDHRAVTSKSGLISLLRRHQPGDRVAVAFSHDGAPHAVDVVLQDRPPT